MTAYGRGVRRIRIAQLAWLRGGSDEDEGEGEEGVVDAVVDPLAGVKRTLISIALL